MAETPSTMLELDTKLIDFELFDFDNIKFSTKQLDGKPVLIVFICNHCPFVKHIIKKFSGLAKDYQKKGVAIVAINSNDIEAYPQDAPDKMKIFARLNQFSFPYLLDETQEIAKLFKAACTPDFYLFNKDHELVYRGQFDDSRPGNNIEVTGSDLTRAINDMLENKKITFEQYPSVGCNIKWKTGNQPEYFG